MIFLYFQATSSTEQPLSKRHSPLEGSMEILDVLVGATG